MTELMISMPPALQSWVEAQIAAGRYADAADYLRDLVRRDRESSEADAQWVRTMVQEGLASGVVDAEPEDVLKEIMARIPND
jgi:antitoxin ParD1/3/4